MQDRAMTDFQEACRRSTLPALAAALAWRCSAALWKSSACHPAACRQQVAQGQSRSPQWSRNRLRTPLCLSDRRNRVWCPDRKSKASPTL